MKGKKFFKKFEKNEKIIKLITENFKQIAQMFT